MQAMKVWLVLMVVGVALWTTPSAMGADVRIGFIDFQRALDQVSEGETTRKQLEAAFESKQAELQRAEREIQAQAAELEKQAVLLSPEALEEKQRALYQDQMAFQQRYMQAEQDMQMASSQAMHGLVDKMKVIAGGIAKERGYTALFEVGDQGLVMGAGGVVFHDTAFDVTAELIKRYNAKHP
jgi:outer membrane protein